MFLRYSMCVAHVLNQGNKVKSHHFISVFSSYDLVIGAREGLFSTHTLSCLGVDFVAGFWKTNEKVNLQDLLATHYSMASQTVGIVDLTLSTYSANF